MQTQNLNGLNNVGNQEQIATNSVHQCVVVVFILVAPVSEE